MAIPEPALSKAEQLVRERFRESAALVARLPDGTLAEQLATVADELVDAYRSGRKVIFFGNGGSAADAQHFAGELCGRFLLERRPLPAIALADSSAVVTSIGNDYSFDDVFARQVEAFAETGDVAIGLTTSGRSRNVLRAMEVARQNGMVTVGLTGASPGPLEDLVDHCLCVPSTSVPRIQEVHALLGHTLCELVEATMFGSGSAT
jgi:D-sedoheptulose 7-phosphate isomerase